jgi:hypothetical protein
LYDRIYRRDVLAAARTQVKRNGGTCGVDGVRIDAIRETPEREEAFLEEIHEQLRTKTCRPQAVKRVMIPKPDGSERPLGIPTLKDRVVQTAAKLIFEPIFAADFKECSWRGPQISQEPFFFTRDPDAIQLFMVNLHGEPQQKVEPQKIRKKSRITNYTNFTNNESSCSCDS